RVRLVAISEVHTEEIFRNFTAGIARYMMPAPASEIAETRAFVSSALLGLDRGDDLQFVICRRGNDEFLGVCGLHGTRRPDEPELGIWLKAQAHGHRYGREAIAALRDWAEEHLEFRRLIYPVDRRNVPSRRVAEALGGKIVGERRVMSLGGAELDEVIYAIERGRA
ncbi:MAG: GNAT family N-acetyltransferase, partial [Gammaproteobacteria bacterium]|nr:GNAT family N-acetyltransferase [Gammaproteobacteria bacterium]